MIAFLARNITAEDWGRVATTTAVLDSHLNADETRLQHSP